MSEHLPGFCNLLCSLPCMFCLFGLPTGTLTYCLPVRPRFWITPLYYNKSCVWI